MFKEKGYDEFLAQQLKESREDIQAGRILTHEESKARTLALLERKAREFAAIINFVIHSRRIYPRP